MDSPMIETNIDPHVKEIKFSGPTYKVIMCENREKTLFRISYVNCKKVLTCDGVLRGRLCDMIEEGMYTYEEIKTYELWSIRNTWAHELRVESSTYRLPIWGYSYKVRDLPDGLYLFKDFINFVLPEEEFNKALGYQQSMVDSWKYN